ncbi:MAG: large-conductance mechanosensitive channel protein MscL [Clostridia bacterium]|nr:large-conductance mechanosensitive channel protein MscL [Clostridia bacterium]
MKFLKEFKEFAFKGNVLDMAVGVVIGTAFGKIVTSIVNDLIMPTVGMITAGKDFTAITIPLKGESAIMIGNFIQSFVDFLIIAASIFMFVKFINMFKKKEEPKPEPPKGPTTEELLSEIRDLLKENK